MGQKSEALRSQLDIDTSAVGVLALKKQDSFQGHVTRNDAHGLEKMALVHLFFLCHWEILLTALFCFLSILLDHF